MRRVLFRSLDLDESELELDPLEESEPELESESESECESELESESDDRFTRFDDFSFPLPFSLSFSLASNIRFAVPFLLLNSSGTSTDGSPKVARSAGFSSCFVLDGRDTYGRVALHS